MDRTSPATPKGPGAAPAPRPAGRLQRGWGHRASWGHVVCTITNDNVRASLQLRQGVTNDHGGAQTNWTSPSRITSPGTWYAAVVTGSAPTLTYTYPAVPVTCGPYTFSEPNVAGYTEGTWSCTGATASGTAYNAGGSPCLLGTVVCTIANDDDGPRCSW